MPAGRKAKPVEQHRREGTRPDTPRTPTLIGGREVPDMPPGLDADAKAVWTLVVNDLAAGRVLDKVDWPAVEEFAVMLGRARQARRALEFEKKEAARKRRELPGLQAEYERELERFHAGDRKTEPVEPDVDPNPGAFLTQAGQKGSRVQAVYLQIEREAWKEARQVGELLGLSPSARARLGLGGAKGRPKGGASKGVPDSPRAHRSGLGVVEGGRS